MIRQAINCDMCGAERLESTSYWFVADENKGEIRLRGWESPQKSRRNARHLCGQKCVQRMMDNFTASILAGLQAGKVVREVPEAAAVHAVAKLVVPPATQKPLLQAEGLDRDDMPILERMGYDRETVAQIEADSWAGPAKPKETGTPSNASEDKWGPETADRGEKGFIHATRIKPQPLRAFQRMA
jgi:hypothetical protein